MNSVPFDDNVTWKFLKKEKGYTEDLGLWDKHSTIFYYKVDQNNQIKKKINQVLLLWFNVV